MLRPRRARSSWRAPTSLRTRRARLPACRLLGAGRPAGCRSGLLQKARLAGAVPDLVTPIRSRLRRCPSSSRAPTTCTARTSSPRRSVQCGTLYSSCSPPPSAGAGREALPLPLLPPAVVTRPTPNAAVCKTQLAPAPQPGPPACPAPHPNTPTAARSTQVRAAGVAGRAAAGARRRARGARGAGALPCEGAAGGSQQSRTLHQAPMPCQCPARFPCCPALLQVRSYLYVEDVAEAFDIILHKARRVGPIISAPMPLTGLCRCSCCRRCARALCPTASPGPLLAPPSLQGALGEIYNIGSQRERTVLEVGGPRRAPPAGGQRAGGGDHTAPA